MDAPAEAVPARTGEGIALRPAGLADVPALTALEEICFETDRLTRRQFRYMLTRAHAATQVAEVDGRLAGYVLLLFSRGTSMARLYSIAVAPDARGLGVARALVQAAESLARERACACIRPASAWLL